MQNNGKIRIAVQRSGRLSKGSLDLLSQMGLDFEAFNHQLSTSCRNLPIDILFLRDDDIPKYVHDGVADLGIVGSNLLEEQGLPLRVLMPLDFGYCSLVIAVPEQSDYSSIGQLQGDRIATSYPRMLSRYLEKSEVPADIVRLRGSVEIAPGLEIADAVCDLVSTGSTLRTHRLRVLETVTHCHAVLVGNSPASRENQELIDKLLVRAEGVQAAKRYKYIMFNAPESSLESIRQLLPGCKAPTVVPLAEPGYVAVHCMVEEEKFWDVVDQVRANGGSDILVAPVEKFIR